MTRFYFLAIFFLVFHSGYLSAQTYTVKYVKYYLNTNVPDDIPLERQRALRKSKKRRRYYTLRIVHNRSSFLPDYSSSEGERDADKRYFLGDMDIYKDFSAGFIYRFAFYLDAGTAIRDSISGFVHWELSGTEDTVIAGFHCRAAIGWFMVKGSRVEVRAWYSPQIPVMDGPSEFAGLPGLIMKTQVGSNTVYEAVDIRVSDDATPVPIPPAKTYTTTETHLAHRDVQQLVRKLSAKVREYNQNR